VTLAASASDERPRDVSVVLLTYNWPQALSRVLDSIAWQRRLPEEVIVADDGSSESTSALLRARAAHFPCALRHVWQEDLGFRAARCRNRGIAVARSAYIVLIDGDMVLHPDFIADHLALARRGALMQGGRIKWTQAESERVMAGKAPVFSPFAQADYRAFDAMPRHYAFRSPWLARRKARRPGGRVMSCNMGLWREDLLACNGFDERMEGYGAEDRELVARLGNAGIAKHPLKWAALAGHLEHRSRAQANVDEATLPNNALFLQTVRAGLTRCEAGIDAHTGIQAPDLRLESVSIDP